MQYNVLSPDHAMIFRVQCTRNMLHVLLLLQPNLLQLISVSGALCRLCYRPGGATSTAAGVSLAQLAPGTAAARPCQPLAACSTAQPSTCPACTARAFTQVGTCS